MSKQVIPTLPKKLPALEKRNITTAEAGLIFLDAIEQQNAETVRQLRMVVENLGLVIEELRKKPRRWRLEVDRNRNSREIVSAVMIAEDD